MGTMRGFIAGILLAGILSVGHTSALTDGGALRETVSDCSLVLGSKDMACNIVYTSPTTGEQLGDPVRLWLPGGSDPNNLAVTDRKGRVVAAAVPAAIATARNNLITALNDVADNTAAPAGKLDRLK